MPGTGPRGQAQPLTARGLGKPYASVTCPSRDPNGILTARPGAKCSSPLLRGRERGVELAVVPGRPALIAEPFEAVEEQVKRELELELLVAARADLLAIGVNTLMLAYLMYRSGLVPRLIAVLGLIGGPLVFASSAAVLFGLYEQVSVWGSIAAIPVFAWEMSLAVWLIAKGFQPSAIASLDARRQPGAGGSQALAAVAG